MKKPIYFILVCMWMLLLPGIIVSAENTTTVWENDYQVVHRDDGSKVIEFHLKKAFNEMKFVGKHSNSSSTISYWTMGYNVSLEPAPNGNISSLGNKVEQIYLASRQKGVSTDGVTLTTEYHLNYKTFVELLQSLLLQKYGSISKANEVLHSPEGVYVYFSNIFRVYKRPGNGVPFTPKDGDWLSGDIYNMNAMLNAQPWSQATLNYLPHYYNVKIQIKLQDYKYDIVFMDENGIPIVTLEKDLPVYQYGTVEYTTTLQEEDTVELGGKTYRFTGTSVYRYQDNTNGSVTKNGNNYTIVHQKQQNAVLYFLLEEVITSPPPPPPVAGSNVVETITPITISHLIPVTKGQIGADVKGAELFDVLQGIPTTEKLYGGIQTSEYLLHVVINKVEGEITYQIPVSRLYHLNWTGTNALTGLPEAKSRDVTVHAVAVVKRSYLYYTVEEIAYYQLESGKLINEALPNGELLLTPKNYSVPQLTYQHVEGRKNHIIEPTEVKGITLSAQTLNQSTTPTIDTSGINAMIPQIKVKNDSMTFGGVKILDNTQTEKTAPSCNTSALKAPGQIADTVLFASGKVIETTKANGTYRSTGLVTYKQIVKFKTSQSSQKSVAINGMNSVTVHTPVYCKGELIHDNKKYVQLINPDPDCVPVVLDTESESADFIVRISNTGFHSDKKGYGTKDYKKYVLRNEVIFPFDVYIDVGNDSNDSNDTLLKANTWYTITVQQRFHVPMWVKEDTYTARFRTIAINGAGNENSDQDIANTASSKYVASDSTRIQVSGKIYGLTLYDINDKRWEPVFRVQNSTKLKKNVGGIDGTKLGQVYNKDSIYYYTVGTKNQYGIDTNRQSKFIFPLIAGSHPHEINQGVLKAGYVWRFTLNTTGSEMMSDLSKIIIQPRFYYVDKEGKNREEVDLYYSAKINGVNKNLVKVGSELDATNLKIEYVNDIGLAIPEAELKITASIRNKSLKDWVSQKDILYTYGSIQTKNTFKTFSNSAYTSKIRNLTGGSSIKIDDNEITRRKQSYYFNYSLPNTYKAVSKSLDISSYLKKGITYKESFWKREGYIIINFEILCYDKSGNSYLSYINSDNYLNYGNCSMWVMEGAATTKTDYYGTKFDFKAGDTIMIYTDKTNLDDYEVGGIY